MSFFSYYYLGDLMKKILFMLLLLIPFSVYGISASSYIVMDMDSGRVLEGKNIDKESLIASITKIMTSVVALEYGDLESEVTINEDILPAFGSGIYIQVGEKLTLDDLLYGLMLRSGNDAALAIASAVAGSKDSFVYLMNQKAMEIGMKNTHFVNPSGLEENDGSANMSTVYDMALLTKYANTNEHYKRIVGTKEIVVKSSLKTYKWINKNKLLKSYEYCTGGKTGFTKKAHRTLVTTASKDDMSLIVVTFNDGNDFADHKELYEKYFDGYGREKIIDKNNNYGDNVYLKNDFYLIKKDGDVVDIDVIIDKFDDKYDGEVVGRVNVLLNGNVIGYRYLYYDKPSVSDKKSFLSKLFEFIKFWG